MCQLAHSYYVHSVSASCFIGAIWGRFQRMYWLDWRLNYCDSSFVTCTSCFYLISCLEFTSKRVELSRAPAWHGRGLAPRRSGFIRLRVVQLSLAADHSQRSITLVIAAFTYDALITQGLRETQPPRNSWKGARIICVNCMSVMTDEQKTLPFNKCWCISCDKIRHTMSFWDFGQEVIDD